MKSKKLTKPNICKVLFVCMGNTFRSRLAEAYLKSKNISGLIVSSSGIEAEKNLNGPVCTYTVLILKKYGLLQYLSKTWRVTNKEEIENQDFVVFMDTVEYEFCLNKLHCNIINYETWNIPDVPDILLMEKPKNLEKIMSIAERDFKKIKENIDILIVKKY